MSRINQDLLVNFLKNKGIFIHDYPEYVDYVGYYKTVGNDEDQKVMKELDKYAKTILVGTKSVKLMKANEIYIFLDSGKYKTSLLDDLMNCLEKDDTEVKQLRALLEKSEKKVKSLELMKDVLQRNLLDTRAGTPKKGLSKKYNIYDLNVGEDVETFIDYVSIYANSSSEPNTMIHVIKKELSEPKRRRFFYYAPQDDEEFKGLLTKYPEWNAGYTTEEENPCLLDDVLPNGHMSLRNGFNSRVHVVRLSNNHVMIFGPVFMLMKRIRECIKNETTM